MGETVWTIGHSNRSAEEFAALVEEHGIGLAGDVRIAPRSRYCPHFNGEAMAVWLAARGIEYVHWKDLGGYRKARADSVNVGLEGLWRGYADHMLTETYQSALEVLIRECGQRRVAIFCAEADPRRCHRRLIADSLAARGVEVCHIVGPGRQMRHERSAESVVRGGRVIYPGAQGTLFPVQRPME